MLRVKILQHNIFTDETQENKILERQIAAEIRRVQALTGSVPSKLEEGWQRDLARDPVGIKPILPDSL